MHPDALRRPNRPGEEATHALHARRALHIFSHSPPSGAPGQEKAADDTQTAFRVRSRPIRAV
jgi:hypothetical protein